MQLAETSCFDSFKTKSNNWSFSFNLSSPVKVGKDVKKHDDARTARCKNTNRHSAAIHLLEQSIG